MTDDEYRQDKAKWLPFIEPGFSVKIFEKNGKKYKASVPHSVYFRSVDQMIKAKQDAEDNAIEIQ